MIKLILVTGFLSAVMITCLYWLSNIDKKIKKNKLNNKPKTDKNDTIK